MNENDLPAGELPATPGDPPAPAPLSALVGGLADLVFDRDLRVAERAWHVLVQRVPPSERSGLVDAAFVLGLHRTDRVATISRIRELQAWLEGWESRDRVFHA